jgi:hypothetical protein
MLSMQIRICDFCWNEIRSAEINLWNIPGYNSETRYGKLKVFYVSPVSEEMFNYIPITYHYYYSQILTDSVVIILLTVRIK